MSKKNNFPSIGGESFKLTFKQEYINSNLSSSSGNFVIYDGSSLSVKLLIELIGTSKGILNCFEDNQTLLINNTFYPVGTKFELINNDEEKIILIT